MHTPNGTRHQWRKWLTALSLVFVCVAGAFSSSPRENAAPDYDPPGPDRFSSVTVDYTIYYWWMFPWKGKGPVCEIEVDHEGYLRATGDFDAPAGPSFWNMPT